MPGLEMDAIARRAKLRRSRGKHIAIRARSTTLVTFDGTNGQIPEARLLAGGEVARRCVNGVFPAQASR
jgi:hypothetical protein